MDININDKFIAKKKTWFIDEGTMINVTNTDKGIISFVFDEDDTKRCRMDTSTFENHFAKVEEKTESEIPEITEEYIADIMENSEFEIHTVFDKCTVVSCRLPNGFIITESSACVNPNDYDEDTGAEICFDKIASKIWELEAYRLQQFLWEEKVLGDAEEMAAPCCCGDCGDCDECDDEYDECLDTDLDCDDCEEYDCPFNPNC